MDEVNLHKSRKKSLLVLFTIVIFFSSLFYFLVLGPQRKFYNEHHLSIHGVFLLKPAQISNFELIDTKGKNFTKQNLQNKWTFIYFGFTRCEIICPNVMSVLNTTYMQLESTLSKDKLPQIVLVTIDPERDSPKEVADFVTRFNSHFIGVSGAPDVIASFEKQLHILAKKQAKSVSNDYTIDHTPDVLLINPEAKIQAYFTYPQRAEYLVRDYQKIIKKFNK